MAPLGNGSHTSLNGQHQAPEIKVDLVDTSIDEDNAHTDTSEFLSLPPGALRALESQKTVGAFGRSHSNSYSSSRGTTIGSRNLSVTSISGETVIKTMTDLDVIPFDPVVREQNYYPHALSEVFSISAETLESILERRSIDQLRALGGVHGLATLLLTDVDSGINADPTVLSKTSPCIDSYTERRRVFGANLLPEKKTKTIFQLMWLTWNDRVLILLTAVAAISLAMGLYQTFSSPHKPGEPKVEWVEGVTILTAVLIVVIVGSLNDYQKEKQFEKLNRKKGDRVVNAIRKGKPSEISIHEVVVGDILYVAPGDLLPADGVLISGYNVRCDESSVTGESNQKTKTPGDAILSEVGSEGLVDHLDPFMISGTKVLEGIGRYMVTGVGVNSIHGKLMMSLTDDIEPTPLQLKLTRVANQIATAGVSVAVFIFLVLLIKFLAELGGNLDTPADGSRYVQTLLRITIVSITVVVIAVPEGLPLAVTLALAFAVTRMLKDNNLVRVLSACETMGNSTSVCCDKTGTLTTNKMTMVGAVVGIKHQFGGRIRPDDDPGVSSPDFSNTKDIPITKVRSTLSRHVLELISQSVVINSTAFEREENGVTTFIGSRTETALLSFARERLGVGPVAVERANAQIIEIVPFDSKNKYMVSIVQLGRVFRMYVKGAPEILLAKSTRVIEDATAASEILVPMDNHVTDLLNCTMGKYSSQSLRMIGLAYREFTSWPQLESNLIEDSQIKSVIDSIMHEMTFIGIFAIHDPVRPGVPEAVSRCQHAGVSVRMVTGDNVGTATAIAKECGILSDGLVLEGPDFRALSVAELHRVVPRLQVLARSSPEDKRILVKTLKEQGEIVAVTGDGTNDGPALRAADVSFSMGISGTEIAREASSIILMDDDFSSIVKAIEWGRAVNDSVKKFLQFQLTVNITAVTMTCISGMASETEESILTPVQLLWVNLIMDTFAALALATDPPSANILDRKPEPKSAPLISLDMWKMIIGQAVYQLVVVLVLDYAGEGLLRYTGTEDSLETLVFNTYVWMQFFNQFNNRRLDNKLNIFDGILKNWYFIGINLITITGQVLIIFFGGSALSAVRLSVAQWGISLLLGSFSLVVGVVVRLIPNELIRNIGAKVGRYFPLALNDPAEDDSTLA